MNIAQHVERGRIFFPNKPALIYQDTTTGASTHTYTYDHLNALANRFANALRALRVEQGDRVALLLPNSPEFVIAYLGTLKIGAIAVSLNVRLQHSEVAFLLNDCGARILVTTEALRPELPAGELPALEQTIIGGSAAMRHSSQATRALDDLLAAASPDFRAADLDRDDPATILYSSGTTGFPKGVTLSHGNVISNAYAKNHYCGMGPDDRMLLYLPLFHCFGQNAVLNSGLNGCATVVLQKEFDPEQVLRTIVDERVSMLFAVPIVFMMLHEMAAAGDLASVHYCLSAAALMPAETARQWQEKFSLIIHEGYGLTESSPFASYNHAIRYKLGSVGAPIENVEMKIVDPESSEELPTGEAGEIVIKGPNVMLGYWNRPEETAQAIRDGWLHTGDIGQVDEEGYFYVVDRLKDMINVAGHKVFPAEVEKIMASHPAVGEVLVYGLADTRVGERVGAKVVLRPGQTATDSDLFAYCHGQLAGYKLPTHIEFVDSIPKNATGKPLRRTVREATPPG